MGIELKQKLETEIKNFDNAVAASKQAASANNLQNINEDLDFEDFDFDDALTIHETINEFAETNSHKSQMSLLENVSRNIEQLIQSETKFLAENFQTKLKSIEFAKRSLSHEEISFGHLKSSLRESEAFNTSKPQLDALLNKSICLISLYFFFQIEKS